MPTGDIKKKGDVYSWNCQQLKTARIHNENADINTNCREMREDELIFPRLFQLQINVKVVIYFRFLSSIKQSKKNKK